MKINRVYIRKIIRNILNEVTWITSPDYDYPAANFPRHTYRPVPEIRSDRVLYIKAPKFNPLEDPFRDYSISGATHARDSHALKHYAEWNPTDVANAMYEIKTRIISDNLEVFLYVGSGIQPQQIDPSEITPGDLINTLDRINDSILNGEFVSFVEKSLYLTYFVPLAEAYETIIDAMVVSATDVTDNNTSIQSVQQMVDLLLGSPVIKFNGLYKTTGEVNTYFYDMNNTAFTSAAGPDNPGNGPFSTVYRITKQHRNETPQQALRFFDGPNRRTVPDPATCSKFIQAIKIIRSQQI